MRIITIEQAGVENTIREMSPEQADALLGLWARQSSERSIHRFRRRARYDFLNDCVMVPYCGMLVGIERDGQVHS